MPDELVILLGSAASIGVVHTVIGPDHYLPFTAMARARGWSLRRTLWITAGCGLGHVLSSVVLGAIGIAAGITLRSLKRFESGRGEAAGWALIAFGLVYLTWSLVRLFRGRTHAHTHVHPDGTRHAHSHAHQDEHAHAHTAKSGNLVPWSLFVIFVLGPCEPLIPLLMFPAAVLSPGAVALVAAVFSLATIATMLALVGLTTAGLRVVRPRSLDRFGQPIAGALVVLCGVAIKLGL
ncbi:MAG TPA: sulfite exporter TauE/SafE family protein [Candidatus Krumholzibacteria bacterium]|nr:sulfite exporter TauE/SafE family protein [Candidatus Krumholzibacteria bacterium]HPD70333.1 sulfite exporter TauE/SafE family protein [Candidatus Krumholzibacteria bacterium]HRY39967.1 sulfite exporter TauE/SafE family protein [Candidatus Krumholzibacteria bacterium]